MDKAMPRAGKAKGRTVHPKAQKTLDILKPEESAARARARYRRAANRAMKEEAKRVEEFARARFDRLFRHYRLKESAKKNCGSSGPLFISSYCSVQEFSSWCERN